MDVAATGPSEWYTSRHLEVGPVTADVECAYTLILGDEHGAASASVYATAEDAWRALDREVRERSRMRPGSRVPDPEATARLADAWRSGCPDRRYWQILAHRIPKPRTETSWTNPAVHEEERPIAG